MGTFPGVHAVVIASPARAHADLVVATAQSGKPVFCEKPMALTLPHADRAIAAATVAGAPLQVGFNRRFASDFRAARYVVSTAVRTDTTLFADASTAELTHFVDCAAPGATPCVTGADACNALAIAESALLSVTENRPTTLKEVEPA